MSIVASPLPHQSFSDTELFAPSGSVSAHAEIPPPLDRPGLIPFPVFQHRHSSPYPAAHHSFSALGPADLNRLPPSALSVVVPPPAPKAPTMVLPLVVGERDVHGELPPTPDPSPPNSKVLFPTTMIKLAPPADDAGEDRDATPRRVPAISIDTGSESVGVGVAGPGPTTVRERAHSGLPTQVSRLEEPARPRSMGPGRPIRRSHTAAHPSAIRMVESKSAESRARLRSSAAVPRHASTHIPNPPNFPRAHTESAATPPRPLVPNLTGNESDFGGPDGLEAKVVLLGSQGVGKTSLILRFTTKVFSPTPAAATIGSSLHTRKLVHAGTRVKLQIWDTAGQERFRSMAPIYYRGAHVCVLVYDVADRASFEDVRSWLEELGRTVPKETVIFVVGSKIDLEMKRVVRIEEAIQAIRDWLKPPAPIPPPLLSPPTSRSLFRSSTNSRVESVVASPTPSRTHSNAALSGMDRSLPSLPPPRPETKPIARSVEHPKHLIRTSTSPKKTFPVFKAPSPKKTSPILKASSPASTASTLPTPKSVPFPMTKPPALTITCPTSPKRLSFSGLASPTLPTSATNTESVSPSFTPSSPTRHSISGGRFSISGVLGYSRTTSMSGAVSSLSKLAEDNPKSPKVSDASTTLDVTPTRVRIESSPLFGSNMGDLSGRRKSEDWSSRSWRMGEGPPASEALGEFGDGVKRKQSGEVLGGVGGAAGFGFGLGGGVGVGVGKSEGGRSRGGSLGRDSRLYGDEGRESGWGVEVEGVRVGEVSSLTGEGVEALFKAISELLAEKKDKIEEERTLRRKGSVMLIDSVEENGKKETKAKGGCC